MLHFIVNDSDVSMDLPSGEVLLDVLRRRLRLTGTKEGCREGDCGACMVLVGKRLDDAIHYKPVNSCLMPVGDCAGAHVVTIEGLNGDGLNPLQRAFVDEGASQCGFCTPGMIVSLTAYLLNAPELDAERAVRYLDGNICRCTGYASIKRAIDQLGAQVDASAFASSEVGAKRIELLEGRGILPSYFAGMTTRIACLSTSDSADAGSANRVLIGGGTDLFCQKPEELVGANLTCLSGRDDLKGIRIEDDHCVIGAAATMEDMERSRTMREHIPRLSEYVSRIASTPIRSRATIGGNVVNASPIADATIALLALNATVMLDDGQTRRELLLRDFFTGYKKLDKSHEEMVTAFRFPVPAPYALFNFEKVSQRTHLDIASVNTAVQIYADGGTIGQIHLSAGGVAPIPLYLSNTCAYLAGKDISGECVREAARIALAEVSPITDVRGSAEYKRLLLRQLIYAHFLKLFPDRVEGGDLW